MLERLQLVNFRCFENQKIEFSDFNVIVGKNDAGKSTIIDALKLLSNVLRYAPYRGRYLEERDIPFSIINLRYNYKDEESAIYASFSDDTEVNIVFPIDDSPYAQFFQGGESVVDIESIRKTFKASLGIIPPVGTFEESEILGNRKYLLSVMVSHLTPRHFRNIWYYFNEGFVEFLKLIEETWPGYTVETPEFISAENKIIMFFREGGITREIFWAGHGFQIWLQLMTFLVKLGRMETLILDEPDIYLHSDMQKKLVNICKERSKQVIIATHAVDIIEEIDPEDIISIDKNSNESLRLSNIDEVQTCVTQLGSYQNLKLVHFIRGKTCLFVEGDDFKYLKVFAKKINIESFNRQDGFSIVPLDGSSNWNKLMYIDWVFKNAFGEKVKCYVILDRDYHTDQEISEITNNLKQKGVKIHVWERKEIENYLINPDILYRMFTSQFIRRYGNSTIPVTFKMFKEKLFSIFEDLKQDALSQIIAIRIRTRSDRSIHESNIVAQVLKEFENNWGNTDYRVKIIPGKDFFAKLNTWLNAEYHITLSVSLAVNFLSKEEVEPEICNVINDFMKLVSLP